jgi:hypothetical protein
MISCIVISGYEYYGIVGSVGKIENGSWRTVVVRTKDEEEGTCVQKRQ